MVSWWSLVRFVHVLSAAVWVGGQLTLSALLLPVLRRKLPADIRVSLTSQIGRRFGLYTLAVFVPVQVGSGIGLAIEHEDVVCAVHLGLMQGMLAELDAPIVADRLEPFVQPSLCVAHLRAKDSAPAVEEAQSRPAKRRPTR